MQVLPCPILNFNVIFSISAICLFINISLISTLLPIGGHLPALPDVLAVARPGRVEAHLHGGERPPPQRTAEVEGGVAQPEAAAAEQNPHGTQEEQGCYKQQSL